jgi:hypothetical protein
VRSSLAFVPLMSTFGTPSVALPVLDWLPGLAFASTTVIPVMPCPWVVTFGLSAPEDGVELSETPVWPKQISLT